MRICPKCQTKYDEAIIRFCTKDGAPLVDENPSFTAMPSESFKTEDIGEETLISRNRPTIPPPLPPLETEEPSKRVVIPIGEEKKQAVRPVENPSRYIPPPRKSNTALVVLLTLFGTIALLGAGIGGWWFLSGSGSSTANSNSNSNNNINSSNLGLNNNTTVSDFGNLNSNINTNANVANANTTTNTNATPTPKPSPTKTPTPKPSPNANANANANINVNTNANARSNVSVNATNVNTAPSNINANAKPSVAPPTTPTPKPAATPTKTPPSNVNVGNLTSRAKELRKPAYPAIAKQAGASGQVIVQISIDEEGHVISAKAISGHTLLRLPAEAAARQSSFNPVKFGDVPTRASGTVVYNFIN